MASSAIADLKDSRVPSCIYWSTEQVCSWIEKLDLAQYKDCFQSNNVNGRNLIMVTASRLPDLGVTDLNHIKKITRSIREILQLEEPYWNKSISEPPRNELGMFIEVKSVRGQRSDGLTFQQYLNTHEDPLWKPPLNNHCQLLPH